MFSYSLGLSLVLLLVHAYSLKLSEYLKTYNNSVEVIHGTGHNKFLVDPSHKVRHKISQETIGSLSSNSTIHFLQHQLPNDEVIAVPLMEDVEDDRPPPAPIKDEYCANPFPVPAAYPFHALKDLKPIEVLWATGCILTYWVYGGDVYVNEFLPQPYFKHVLVVEATVPQVFICFTAKDAEVILRYLYLARDKGKPTVLFHLGDEYHGGSSDSKACIALYTEADLVLREYRGNAQHYELKTPVIQIPLSYNQILRQNGVDQRSRYHSLQVAEWSLNKGPSERSYHWSFIGAIFSDNKNHRGRRKAVDTFSPWTPNFQKIFGFENQTTIGGPAVAAAYNASVFVVGDLGYVQIDCCRYYEAIISGAIPIIVVPDSAREIESTFNYNGHPLPIIMVKSWEEGYSLCKSMTTQDIQKHRLALFNWYNATLIRAYEKIVSTLLREGKNTTVASSKGLDEKETAFSYLVGEKYYTRQKTERGRVTKDFIDFNPNFPCIRGVTALGEDTPRSIEDGHKFGCGIPLISSTPIVYSFGSNRQQDFEASILRIHPNARVYTFELVESHIPAPHERNPKVDWNNIGLGYDKSTGSKFKSFQDIMISKGHSYVDVVKMDIDGGEWNWVFKEGFVLERIGQLLIEIHVVGLPTLLYPGKTLANLMDEIEKYNMRMFFKEINHAYPFCCSEFSFVQKNWGLWDSGKQSLQPFNSIGSPVIVAYENKQQVSTTISNNQSRPVYFKTSNEGMSSILKQIEIIFNVIRSVNRKMILIPFQNDQHYPGAGHISLCDFFYFHSGSSLYDDISCTSQTMEIISKTNKCVYGSSILSHGKDAWPTPSSFEMPESTIVEADFDWSTVDCVAGFFPHPSVVKGKHGEIKWTNLYLPISFKYQNISAVVKKQLGITDVAHQHFVTAHWRRGDALHDPSMCNPKNPPINCQSTELFLAHLRSKTVSLSTPILYIATNEANKTELQKVKDAGFFLYSDMANIVKAQFPSVSPVLNNFIIDLMLMCDPLAFPLFFGVTLVERLVKRCRSVPPIFSAVASQ